MQFAVVAHRPSDTNYALAGAAASLGLPATVLPPRDALRTLEPGDIALGRLDVRDELDGVERGTEELEQLAASGWGRDVVLCPTADDLDRELAHFAQRPWFSEQGVLAQELVPPLGWDLRIVVAGGRVVGAARRVAAPGEWRTNVALGARSEPVAPPPLAQTLALEAAAAIRGDLVGIDLLPLGEGFVVSEVNGAVDFKARYALSPGSVFRIAMHELVRVAQLRRAAA
jgi:hypothetical protein